MKYAALVAAFSIVGGSHFSAALRAASADSARVADEAWNNIVSLATPTGLSRVTNGRAKTQDEIKTEIKQQAGRSRQAASDARKFHTDFPSHPKAAEARKIEAIATIRGVEIGNTAQEQAAMALGKAFRETSANSVADRFEVALAMDRLDLSSRIKSRKASGRPQDWKAVGDKLKAEFGDVPALHDYYMDIARTADRQTAAKIATEVSRSAAAPATAKDRAKAVLEREALVGKNISAKLVPIDGGTLDLAVQTDKVTVVLAWSPSDSSTLAKLKRFEKSLPRDAQVVYLAMGGTAGQVAKGKNDATVPGIHCHAPAGPLARAANEGLRLQYSTLPRIYVLNRTGVLVGFGRVEDLPALIGKVSG